MAAKRMTVCGTLLLLWLSVSGQETTDTIVSQQLEGTTVTARRAGTRNLTGALNGTVLNREELFKAACCNLGESFTTNPSVDVNYTDAATGAKQIKLLGLSGTYVQMLTENLPNFRGAAAPYALDYVPGPWMNAIQVSKGASSVRNGYESITGQIDVEYLKPDDDQGITVNLYGNTLSRTEANADGNLHLNDRLSTELLLHYQDDYGHHDQNDDGFLDQPNIRQWNLQNRWKWRGNRHLFHGGLALVKENREGGQTRHTAHDSHHLYTIGIETDRYEGYIKHAIILSPEHGASIAFMGHLSMHETAADYGNKRYTANQKNAYAQLMFETNVTEEHQLSAGLSLSHDHIIQKLRGAGFDIANERESTPGAYVQYTYNANDKFICMAGVRADHSNLYGTFVTPRLHVKITPSERFNLRLSAGKGYRSPHPLAENHYLLASGRELVVGDIQQEGAWNFGVSGMVLIPLFHKTMKVNAEYFHTHFDRQLIIDYESCATEILVTNLNGRSYSNTLQIDAAYPLLSGLELTAAYRLNDVKTTLGGRLMEKPLTSRYKGLLTASYKTPLGLWQFDVTLQMNGGGRIVGEERFTSYEQLSAQATRWFRHLSIYIGGENLTARRQHVPIRGADDPWGSLFDTTFIWGPVHGAIAYAGIRVNFGRL